MIERPKGEALSFHRGVWNVVYYQDKTRKTKSLSTDDLELARRKRDEFFVNAIERKTHDENTYIYHQLPFMVKVGKKLIGRYKTKKLAREARDKYLSSL